MLEKVISLLRVKGRANRAVYWKTVIVTGLATSLVAILLIAAMATPGSRAPDLSQPSLWIVGSILCAVIVLGLSIMIAVTIRRLHDVDRRGWWIIPFLIIPSVLRAIAEAEAGPGGTPNGAELILLIAAFGLAVWGFVEIGCLGGAPGENRFGPDPLNRFTGAVRTFANDQDGA